MPKKRTPWWGTGERPHVRWPGVIEIPVEWTGRGKTARWGTPDGRFYFDDAAADFAAGFFPAMLEHFEGEWNGRPFELLDYQRYLVRAAFGWKRTRDNLRRFRKLFVAVPKGSGKSPLASGLALLLAFFDNEPGAQVFVVANDRKQGRIVHDGCKVYVHRSEHLDERLEVFADSIKLRGSTSTECLQILSSDVATAHGYRPHGVIFDEFHGQPNRDLFEALYRGMGKKRQPMLVMVSTAGNNDESICAEEWEYARRVIDDPSIDETYLPIIFEAKPEDDWADPEVWRRVNPGFGVTIKEDYFVNECRAAQAEPRKRNSFLQLHLNRWVNQATAWIPVEWWDACPPHLPSDDVLQDLECAGGLDMAQKYDLAAFVVAFREPLEVAEDIEIAQPDETGAVETKTVSLNYRVHLLPFFWIPEDTMRQHERTDKVPYSAWVERGWVSATPGDVIDYDRVHRDILAIVDRFPRLRAGELGFDQAFARDISQRLAGEGLTTVEVPQTHTHMNEPCHILEALIRSGRITHNNNRCMRWNVENVEVKQDAGGRIRPVKSRKSVKRIDGVVAALMAVGRLEVQEQKEYGSVWDDPNYEPIMI